LERDGSDDEKGKSNKNKNKNKNKNTTTTSNGNDEKTKKTLDDTDDTDDTDDKNKNGPDMSNRRSPTSSRPPLNSDSLSGSSSNDNDKSSSNNNDKSSGGSDDDKKKNGEENRDGRGKNNPRGSTNRIFDPLAIIASITRDHFNLEGSGPLIIRPGGPPPSSSSSSSRRSSGSGSGSGGGGSGGVTIVRSSERPPRIPTTFSELVQLCREAKAQMAELKRPADDDHAVVREPFRDGYRLPSLLPHLLELQNMVGLQKIKQQLVDLIVHRVQEGLPKTYLGHVVIHGGPGVGKTTFANILAKILHALGDLKNSKVVHASAQNMIADFLGQTSGKTAALIKSAFGGVLLLDEASSLSDGRSSGNGDSFSKSAIDTLNRMLTEHGDKFVCVIAGYKDEIKRDLMDVNPGLARRFTTVFAMDKYTPAEMKEIAERRLDAKGFRSPVVHPKRRRIAQGDGGGGGGDGGGGPSTDGPSSSSVSTPSAACLPRWTGSTAANASSTASSAASSAASSGGRSSDFSSGRTASPQKRKRSVLSSPPPARPAHHGPHSQQRSSVSPRDEDGKEEEGKKEKEKGGEEDGKDEDIPVTKRPEVPISFFEKENEHLFTNFAGDVQVLVDKIFLAQARAVFGHRDKLTLVPATVEEGFRIFKEFKESLTNADRSKISRELLYSMYT
jgi:hypothetical protein